jgi:hypothetical protein
MAILQEHYFKKGIDFFDFQMKILLSQDFLKISSNYETIPNYLFELNEFKIIEYFFKFNFVDKNLKKYLILHFLTFANRNFDHLLRVLCTFVMYFLRNNFFCVQEVLDVLSEFTNGTSSVRYDTDQTLKINKKLKFVCLYEQNTPKTLLFFSKQAIKKCFKIITSDKIKQLDLPKNLKDTFLDTELIDESTFEKIYN